jgi:ribosomal small subunit protein bTHX
MGKGDIKTKKGKRSAGSFGVSRKRKKPSATIIAKPKKKAKATPKKETAAKATTKKAAAKPAAKKSATKKTTTKKSTTAKK